ncbi:MAG: electron transfer flavoprotein subunit alpha/FixB family protein [archaeon YNP-LCB-024-027]|nr:electron transfer flavoprotein subunit alpha/FixB family protein [Candidatus Culexarchaeum yellowstonense]
MHATIFSESPEALIEISTKLRETLTADLRIDGITKVEVRNPGDYGIDKLHIVKDLKSMYEAEAIIGKVAKESSSKLIILESNKNNREIAARIAAKLNAGYIADCIDLRLDSDGGIVANRMIYASKAIETIKSMSDVTIMTMPRRITEPKAQWKIKCEIVYEDTPKVKAKTTIIDAKRKELSAIPLEAAEVIVSVGRGFKRKEDCKMAEELAKILGGVVSCSRPVAADLKWFNEWVGLSGHKVSPKLYIAIGISGAIQHLAGIQGAKVVVAINKDAEAPMIKSADYGVVADLYEFIPKLIEKLKATGAK